MRIRIIDAFADRPFAGNPAAVCLLDTDTWPDEGWMQRVAAEMNLSETAFSLPRAEGADRAIRWFTPVLEVNLCGHATLATAHALHADRGTVATVRFASRSSGILTTHTHDDGTIVLDFPAAPPVEAPIPDGLAEALGAAPEATYRTGALGDLLLVLPDEAAVRGLKPDLTAVAALTPPEVARGVIVTAPAAGTEGYDFVSRYFSPADGIPEDPVTGSAHTALAPYWSRRLGRDELTGLQASARTGLVRTAVRGDRVHLTGRAVTVLDGTLHANE
ncbi:PhzF family phenazine biosynthesis protein [Amycolatopsis anabasis]|uniref:PhzF family phenazine biosynthesis protein n=1 Tax=Amycolatopsis anabasis TaxID=1840409 RepID=UPI00131EA060|nr:PhzF family phenazine biosynthesis protein [Amycolatopsis anabasis]